MNNEGFYYVTSPYDADNNEVQGWWGYYDEEEGCVQLMELLTQGTEPKGLHDEGLSGPYD